MDTERNEQEPKEPIEVSYEPPRVAWEELLEIRASLASSCSRQPNAGGQCNAHPAAP